MKNAIKATEKLGKLTEQLSRTFRSAKTVDEVDHLVSIQVFITQKWQHIIMTFSQQLHIYHQHCRTDDIPGFVKQNQYR